MLPGCEIAFVTTYEQAIAALEQNRFGGAVIAMSFDQSRMFGLLAHVRTTCPDVPVACVRIRRNGLLGGVIHAGAATAASLAI